MPELIQRGYIYIAQPPLYGLKKKGGKKLEYIFNDDALTKRLEEIGFGLLSNEAILIQDRKTAEKNNDLYNKADSASIELAKKFPETFAQPLVDAYTQASSDFDDQLMQLRNDVGRYDSFLRDYLGNETQES